METVIEQHPLLQRRQRVDVLNIGHPSWYRLRYPIDLRLIQCHQWQHLRRDVCAGLRDQVGRCLPGIDFLSADLRCQVCQASRLEHLTDLGLQSCLSQFLHH